MARVWQRLADQYEDATPPFSTSGKAAEQPALQQHSAKAIEKINAALQQEHADAIWAKRHPKAATA
jgi:hypothetical protein